MLDRKWFCKQGAKGTNLKKTDKVDFIKIKFQSLTSTIKIVKVATGMGERICNNFNQNIQST